MYFYDIVIFSRNEEQHFRNIEIVIKIITEAHLKLKIKKYSFMQKKIEHLGHILDSKEVQVDPRKVVTIKEFSATKNLTHLRSFLVLAGYYRRFNACFADMSALLHAGTSMKAN